MSEESPLQPFGPVIQICPDCGKVDAFLNDGHDCGAYVRQQINEEHGDG